MGALRNSLVFLKQFGTQFKTTGSILPSGPALARSITSELGKRGDEPVRVLECGPGTGAFTSAILSHLRPGDTFDLVELNPIFVGVLNKRFETEPAWAEKRDLATVHERSLDGFEPERPYDFIVSGIPHVNLPPDLVQTITDTYFRVLSPRGVLSYFSYAYISSIRKTLTLGMDTKQTAGVSAVMKAHFATRGIRRDTVMLNVPPAWVHFLSGTPHSVTAGSQLSD